MTAPRIASGTVIAGKYTVGTCLGFGGSAATYHAAMAGNREVAVKVFDPGIRQRPEVMKQIEQIYAATNAMPEGNVAPILDAGFDSATGAPFAVTERITFASVAQFVPQRTMTPEEIGSVLVSMGRALDVASQDPSRRMFHHAIKPSNVFVNSAAGFKAKLMDFGAGLARSAAPSQEGHALAAPWLAPEQAQNTQAGAGADVFAVGLLVFYALTGRSYWLACQGETPDFAGWQRELLSPRTLPSARALQLGVTLSPGFDAVLGRALTLDPDERFPSVTELAMAFEGLVGTRGPDSAATMAFNAAALLGGGGADYPPAPAPLGQVPGAPVSRPGYAIPPAAGSSPYVGPGYAPAPGYSAGMAPPHGAVPGHDGGMMQPYPGAQPMPIGSAPGDYSNAAVPVPMPAGSNPGQRPIPPREDAALQTAAAIRGNDLSPARAPASTKVAPILVALVALVLIAGSGAAYVMLGKHGTVASSGGTKTATSDAPVADSAPAPATSTTAPVASTDTTATEPAPAVVTVDVTIVCDPSCDEIKVDDVPVSDPTKPAQLTPGKHTLTLSREGFAPLNDTINVEAGKKLTKKYRLAKPPSDTNPTPKPTSTGPVQVPPPTGTVTSVPPPSTGPKNCGKFLKRCK